MKQILKRFLSLALSVLMVCSLVPGLAVTAYAATSGIVTGLADENIGLSFTGSADNAWSASGTQIIGKARSTSGSGCGGSKDYSSTLTITNNKTTEATLSFDYTVVVSEGTILVNYTTIATAGSFSQKLAAGGTVEVEIKSGSTSADTQITMTNVKLVSNVNATVTFQPAENGSYTVDGNAITEAYTNTQSSMTAYQVVATPAEGYRFKGWYDVASGKCISTDAKTSLNFDSDRTITARFVSKELALFETGGQIFDDLNDAIREAQNKPPAVITLAESGKITGNYTIPSKVTLLIPFDEAKTCYTSTPTAITSASAATPFRTLTMAAGSSLTLASGAAISVGGQYYAASGGQQGRIVGPYGYIKMESGSTIDVKSGGALYAWGFISGSGSVTVQSGGSVYEWYQVLDFRGGSASSAMGNEVFPFNQYAVQNVEVPLTLHAGASETVYTAVYAVRKINPTSIPFIGDTGMFKIVSGSLTKAYDGATDRIIYTIDGVAEVNSLNLKLAGMSVSSSSYVLPLTNNMTINLNTGSKLTINQTAALLPGVQASIAEGAELVVSKGKSIYIYDVDEWGGYCGGYSQQFIPVVNAPGRTGKRAPLADVQVDVNGTLTASGSIYTTKGGADICSSGGTGVYNQQGGPGTETTTYQYTQSGSDVTLHKIPITSAKLHNEDGTYTETANASAGDVFDYIKEKGKWAIIPNEITVSFNANNGEGTMESQTISTKEGGMLTANAFTREGYNFTGWNTAADGSGDSYVDGATVNLTEDTTLYAQWEIQKFTVTWVNDNGTELEKDENVEYGTTPEYNGETPTKAGDAQYTYTFSRWDPEISKVTADITYKAVYEQTVNTYTVIWKNEDGTILETAQVEYGAIPEYRGEMPTKESTEQYTYAFEGWTPEITVVTGDAEYTATFTDTIRTYTVTWKNWDDTVLETDENVGYGTTPVYNGETPTKPADAQYTYTFTGWVPVVSAVTGDITYTAVFSETLNKYTITWKNGDEVLKIEQMDYGTTPVYSGETPVKDGDAQYSYTFTGWTPEIMAVTGDAEYTAVFEQKVNTYTVTWKNDENILKQDKLEYGETPAYEGEAPVKEADEKYNYIFAGWEPEISPVEADITHNAKFNAEERVFYTITFNANGGAGSMEPQIIEKGNSAILSGNLFNRNDGYGFAGWNTVQEPTEENPGMNYSDESEITPTENMTLYAQWKFMNGWLTDVNGKQYYKDGELQKTGWTVIDGSTYYLDIETGYAATGLCELVPEGGTEEALCAFDADGVFQGDKTGLYDVDNDTYWINSGIVEKDKGLTQVKDENGNNLYYYFAEDGNAVKNVPTGGQDFWISKEKTNELLPEWGYYFDENGIIPHDEQFQNGICEDGGVKYYYIDGIKVHMGMFKIDEDYYYAKSNGQLIVNGSYYCSRMNDLLPEGTYTFDAEGKAILPDTSKNGIIAEDDSLYYYVKGERNYAGLIEVDGDYYYVKTNGEVVHGCRYWITKTNGLMAEHSYEFAEDGKMLNPEIKDTSKNGIVAENDSLYYYEDGIRTYAGLIEIDGSYYYVRTNGELAYGRSYWVTKTNGLMGERSYTFADDGKMLDPQIKDNTKDGIVSENGTMFYYKDGVKTYAGLIEIDGSYYYVKTSGEVIHGRKYWISKTNGLMKEGSYTFADDGKMILN